MKTLSTIKLTTARRNRPGAIWTDAELLALDRDGRKHELWMGKVITMAPAGFDHGDVNTVLSHALADWVYKKKLGRVYDGQTGYRLSIDICYAPDVSFVSRERFKLITLSKHKLFHGSPDLAVEVLSPSDSITKTEIKVVNYLAHGTRLVWMVDMRNRSVRVYRPGESFELLRGNRVLTGNSVVPGFRLSLAKLFEGI
jgi:Uma2 family endonuclease